MRLWGKDAFAPPQLAPPQLAQTLLTNMDFSSSDSDQQHGVSSHNSAEGNSTARKISFDLSSELGRISASPSTRLGSAAEIEAFIPQPAASQPESVVSGSTVSEGVVLPPLKNEAFLSQRHEVNPALALNLLEDIQAVVTLWQEQLRQVVQTIRLLYAQGPMVDGWLESSAIDGRAEGTALAENASDSMDSAVLRHGDADALMQYVEALEQVDGETSSKTGASDHSSTQYSLCCLDDDGQVRSQPCPSAQMAMVSTAIARYRKFKQLMSQKQILEAKLQSAVDELTGIRTRFQQTASTD